MSTLGTLLATRLDAVLGTTLAQHPVLLQGSRGNPTEPAQALHAQANTIRRSEGEIRHLPGRAGEAASRGVEGRSASGAAGQAAAQAGADANASSRTQLSEPARTILALLLSGMQGKGALQGRVPLLPLPMPGTAGAMPGRGMMPGGAAGAGSAAAAGGTAAGGAGSAAPGAAGSGGAAGGAAGTAAGTATGSAAGTALGTALTGGASGAASGAAAGGGAAGAGNAGAGAGPGSALPSGAAMAGAGRAALPPGPPGLLPALQTALQQTVSQSGLFYESHLSQLAFGQRGAAELLQEPQARLPQPGTGQGGHSASGQSGQAAGGQAAGAAAAAATASNAAASAAAASTASSQAQASAQVSLSAAASGLSQTASQSLAGIHPDAAALVRQQLEALANQAFAWQGQAWHDAPMHWQIQRREPEVNEAIASWATTLRLQLPRLGEVEARLNLVDNRLVLQLAAPASAPLLQAHLDVLRERLQSQGIQLTDTAIAAHTESA